jgi:DNA-binding beta-propeller fold protein YncE
MKKPLVVGVVAFLSACGAAQAQQLLVTNQYAHSLSFIDPATAKAVAVIDEAGVTGHEVVVSPDGKTAYVPMYGNAGVGKPGTDGSTMQLVDVPSRKIVGALDFGHGVRPHKPIWDAKRGVLYVTTELDKTITIVDPKTRKIVGTIPTGQEQSHMFVLSHDGKRGYTANVGPGTVSVLDMETRKLVKIIPIAKETQRIAVSNDDSMVFTADQIDPRLAVIDTKTLAIKNWVKLPAIGYGTAATKDGRWLIVAIRPLHEVVIVDLQKMEVAKTVALEEIPTEILVRPDGKVAYVSCGHRVAAIDTATWTVQSWIDAENGADGLAWAR